MTVTPTPPDLNEALHDALLGFTGCVGTSIDICSYGITIGEAYVPFDKDDPDEGIEEKCDADCSQLWVRVMSVQVASSPMFDGGECGGVLRLDLEVGVTRCITIPDGGEAPTETDVMLDAMQSMSDMQDVYRAAMSCEVWESIQVGQWTPSGPLGGYYGGIWTFVVELDTCTPAGVV